MTDHDNGAVRITNNDIYKALTEQGRKIDRLEGKFNDVLKPSVDRNTTAIESLKENKADKSETAGLKGEINAVRVQTYAIGSGVLAGLIMLRTLGVI